MSYLLASQVLDAAGLRLFGPEWAAPMARLTDTNERTVRRIRAAAAEGREYPAARGVLAALSEALSKESALLQRYARDPLAFAPKGATAPKTAP